MCVSLICTNVEVAPEMSAAAAISAPPKGRPTKPADVRPYTTPVPHHAMHSKNWLRSIVSFVSILAASHDDDALHIRMGAAMIWICPWLCKDVAKRVALPQALGVERTVVR